MAVTMLETLVLRTVSVVGNVGTERERIGSMSAADQTLANLSLICDPSPSYPPADNQPKPRPGHAFMAEAVGRAGRSGSWQGALTYRSPASSTRRPVLSGRFLPTEQPQRTTKRGLAAGAFTASIRGERVG